VALFHDAEAEGLDCVMIVDGLVPDNEGRVRYTWDTAGVAAGEYYVYARAMDEVNVPVAAHADAPVEISDPAPKVTSLAADLGPVIHSAALTLTAVVAFEPIDDILQVEFYRGDDLLGADAVLEPSSVDDRVLAGSDSLPRWVRHALLPQDPSTAVTEVGVSGAAEATFARLGAGKADGLPPWVRSELLEVPWVAPARPLTVVSEAAEHADGRPNCWDRLEEVLTLLVERTPERLLVAR
jgi:hypothetical protein